MTTATDIAQKYGKTPDEVRKALQEVGVEVRSVAAKVPLDVEAKLDAYFKDKTSPAPKAAARSVGTRQIGGTQVTEKKVRTINRPAKTAAAVVDTPDTSETPDVSATPVKKTAQSATSTPAKSNVSDATRAAESLLGKQAAAQAESEAKKAAVKTSAAKAAGKTETAKAETPKTETAKAETVKAEAATDEAEKEPDKEVKPRSDKTIKVDRTVVRERERRRRQRMTGGKRPPANIHGFKQPVGPVSRELPIPEFMSASKLAADMAVKTSDVIRKLMDYGMEEANPNMLLDRETAWVIVEEFGHTPVQQTEDDNPEAEILKRPESAAEQKPRPAVVTIMGHVDHGKTSLLDYIRKTRVAVGEAGGITQHIGAYQVGGEYGNITFLDTPGHALFSQMRARGAQLTDIVVLVVAGDDGVKPQTEEAVSHAKSAGVPIVVAVNKSDKEGFDLERAKSDLASLDVLPEDWGGDAIFIPVSAHTGEGIDALLDAIRTQSDILELKAAHDAPAHAAVVEARVDKGRGALTTVIVREGILRRGEYVVCGTESGRVRAMWDSNAQMMEYAEPSMPVEIQGLSGLPEVGEDLVAVEDERKAREVADLRQERRRLKTLSARATSRSISSILSDDVEEKKELNVIIKADVGGSREALSAALSSISGKKAAIKVIHSAVGGVSESDINLARAGNALIIAFNVRPDGKSRKLAQAFGVKILRGNVIYELMENAKDAVLDLLDMEREEKVIGMAEVLQVFSISKVGNIAGCRVSEGVIRSDVRARLVRDGTVVYEGDIASLRHFKELATEVRSGEECGIAIRRFNDIKAADVIEAVQVTETPPTL